MKHILTALLIIFAGTVTAQSAADKELMNNADRELRKNKNCGKAWDYLRQVSDAYKNDPKYLLLQARVYDCRYDRDLAISFYRQYLDKMPGNDSVAKRIEYLQRPGLKVDPEKEKKAKRGIHYRSITGPDLCIGLSTDFYTSRAKAPFMRGFNIFNDYEIPFADNRFVFDGVVDFGLLTRGNKQWAGQALDVPDTLIQRVNAGFRYGLQLSVSAVLKNEGRYALTAGPILGFSGFNLTDAQLIDNYGSKEFNTPMIYSVLAGLKTTFYVGSHCYISAAYIYPFRSRVENDLTYAISSTPYNGSALRISIGIKGFGEPAAGGDMFWW